MAQVALAASATWAGLVYRRGMRRADVSVIALAVAAGILGVAAHTGPLFPGLAVLVVAGLLLRTR